MPQQRKHHNRTTRLAPNDVCIVASARTPIGAFGGSLRSLTATRLGAEAINACFQRNKKLSKSEVQEVIMGNVLSANLGQAPARQAAIFAQLPTTARCTTINKVCASGMKAIMYGAQSLMIGLRDGLVVCGGMESMSNVPYYAPDARFGKRMGDAKLVDGMVKDGLWDVYNDIHMGNCGELCSKQYGITREEQDTYAIESFVRAQRATKEGIFHRHGEITPVNIESSRGSSGASTVKDDECIYAVNFDKLRTLNPAFDKKNGTVTAANSSSVSDGAAAVVLCTATYAQKHGLDVEFVIRCFDDAEQEPEQFTTTPTKAMQLVLDRSNLTVQDIDVFELNEAFAVVALVNMKLMNIPHDKINIFGGGCSIGHPIGASGARIVTTMMTALRHTEGRYGMASVCNGGGGASCVLLERLPAGCDISIYASSKL